MSTTMQESIRWHVGVRVNRLGDHLCKLGDRIHRNAPIGLEEAYELGYAMGHRKPGESLDVAQILAKAATR